MLLKSETLPQPYQLYFQCFKQAIISLASLILILSNNYERSPDRILLSSKLLSKFCFSFRERLASLLLNISSWYQHATADSSLWSWKAEQLISAPIILEIFVFSQASISTLSPQNTFETFGSSISLRIPVNTWFQAHYRSPWHSLSSISLCYHVCKPDYSLTKLEQTSKVDPEHENWKHRFLSFDKGINLIIHDFSRRQIHGAGDSMILFSFEVWALLLSIMFSWPTKCRIS